MFGLFKKIFFRRKRKKRVSGPIQESPEEILRSHIREARGRLERFLLTRTVTSGEVKRTRSWRLLKTSESLFRLESQNLSLLINTRPFLIQKEEQLNGLLRIDEAVLCRLLHDNSDLAGFISHSDPLSESSLRILESNPALIGEAGHELPAVSELEHWNDFDVYQVIARSSLNTLAHLIINGSSGLVERLLERHLSARVKLSLIQELEFLLSPASDPAMNPHSRARSLYHFDEALYDLRTEMGKQQQRKRSLTSLKIARKQLP